MAPMPYRTVVFDLDGTLIDTVELILASHRHATEAVLGAALPDDVLRAGIGTPLLTQMRSFDERRAQQLYDTYRAFNRSAHDEYLQPYDGILVLLERLRASGAAIAVATSKSRDTVQLAFDRIPLEPLLDALVTVDECERGKPHPEPIERALKLLGRGPEDACYVGD